MNKILLMNRPVLDLDAIAMHNRSGWMELHQSLIELRIKSGMTQADVAKEIGISQSAVSQFETLTRLPNLDTVFTYALAVGAKLDFSVSSE